MSLLQCVLTGSPGYGKAEPRKKVMSVCSALPPEPSLSWEEQVSLVFSRCVSVGSVWGKMDFLHVLSEYLHQRELIPLLGRWGGEGEGGGAVMSVNAATKAITHDKFSTDRGSHRCWETFRLILGTCQPELSSVLTRSMPHRHCVYTSWYRIVTAKPNYSCNFCTYFIGIASRNPMIAIWCRGERSTSHIFARCLTVLKVLHNVRCSHEVRGHWLFFYIVWLHSTLKLNDDNEG